MDIRYSIRRKAKKTLAFMLCVFTIVGAGFSASAQEDADAERIKRLEQEVQALQEQLENLKQEEKQEQKKDPTSEDAASSLSEEDVADLKKAAHQLNTSSMQTLLDEDSWLQRFTLGGYGELHANFNQGSADDQYDLHRLVGYVGYDFADWIKLHSEIEVKNHAQRAWH